MKRWLAIVCMLILALAAVFSAAALAASGEVVLPETLKTVEAEAFAGNAKITSLVIPKTVNAIESRAFANCTGLREVIFSKNTSLKIAENAFMGCGDIHFSVFPDTPGELFALAHGYRCDRLEDGSPFMERALQLVTQHGGTMSILQSADFSTMRLVTRMTSGRLPDISAYRPVKILRKDDGIFFLQFGTVQNTADCYGYLKNIQKSDSSVAFVEPDACVEAIDDVEAVGTVSGMWDTDDPMGFDEYAPYVAGNSTGRVTIAIIDSGVKKLSAYFGMLRADGVNLVSDGKDCYEDNLLHGSMIAGIIRDCVGNNNVELLPIRVVSGSNIADCSMIALGIEYAIDRGVDIINLSLNFDDNEYVRYALKKAVDTGIRVVVAAGNSHRNIDKVFPANVPGMTVVSGIDSAYSLSASSNYGDNVTYCAPDTDVVSTAFPSMTRRGTSFGAPMVASALALAKLDNTHSESDLKTVCRQLSLAVSGTNNYGNGLIQLNQLISEGYTISYDANGGDNAPQTQDKVPGLSVELTTEIPTRNYVITLDHGTGEISTLLVAAPFINWNTSKDGSGTIYAPGANYFTEQSVRLYAQWDGGTLDALSDPTRIGYRFDGWYTSARGGVKVNTNTVTTRNVTLYAHWTEVAAYAVAYDANGGTGAPDSQIKYESFALILSTTKPTKTNVVTLDYGTGETETRNISATFKSWNTGADGKETSYAPGAAYTADEAVTLYAQWNYGKIGTLPTPTRDGYAFDGWYTTAAGNTRVTEATTVKTNRTIYAHWIKSNVTLDGTTLRISGNGSMDDMLDEIQSYKDSGVTSVVIGEGVTDIGNNAFRQFGNLTSVTIPGSVTAIGEEAFAYCERLTDISIPDSVTSIGSGAFLYCTSLTGITIPDGVTSIENSTFQDCRNLTSVTIPDSVTSIGDYAFNSCHALTDLAIPDSVVSIGIHAFHYSNLSSVTIPRSMTAISESAFWGCANLSSVVFHDDVTDIGGYAFRDCSSLTDISIPDSVKTIGEGAFGFCSGLTEVEIPYGVTDIGDYAFYSCSNLSAIVILESVVSIGSQSFGECGALTIYGSAGSYAQTYAQQCSIPFAILDAVKLVGNTLMISGKGIMNDDTIQDIQNYRSESVTKVVIAYGITNVGYRAFDGFVDLMSVTLPSSINSIDEYAFNGCASLASITIPDSFTRISIYAFSGCSSLASITIPDSVTRIGVAAFSLCSSLTSITIPDSVTSIEDGAFEECISLTSITIPDGVTSIERFAFAGCNSLKSISIPDGVTSIGFAAFYECSNLTSITIPDGVTSIGEKTFYECSNLTSITIPDSVTSIGEYAFFECSNLTSITIPDSMTSIEDAAFEGCVNLTSITIPDSVTCIGDYAFGYCKKLTIICNEGSYAHSYAQSHSIPFCYPEPEVERS